MDNSWKTLCSLFSLAAWGWAVAVALDDRFHAPRLESVDPDVDGPLVSVVVPARNEEGRVGPALESLATQDYRRLEVIVVDDESSDRTAAEARSVDSDRIRVVSGEPLPPEWIGKSWATHQGARAARGEWLLFTDADVIHGREVVARAIALARKLDSGGLTILCRLDSGSPGERIVQPAAATLIRSFVAPGLLVRSPRSGTAIAVGAFILVRRDVYGRVGGHAAVRHHMVDDQALAVLLKRAGEPLVLVEGHRFLRVRMYHGLREVWRGWRKNSSYGLAEGSLAFALLSGVAGVAVSGAPLLALARGPRRIGAAALVLQLVARAAVDGVAPTPRRYWLTMPLGCLFMNAVSLVSSVDRVRGGVEWRGRRYASRRR